MGFTNYTSKMRELIILMEIEKNSAITQNSLAKAAELVPSMVNTYIKRFVEEHYIKKSGNNRNTLYSLTQKGFDYKNYLLISYLAETMDNLLNIERYMKELLHNMIDSDNKKIILYGAGETGRVCARLLKNMKDIDIVGFIDDDKNKIGTEYEGITIYPFKDISKLKYDAILISTFKDINMINSKLKKSIHKNKIYSFINSVT
jgi:FlaA1/EpsC-like NDP-sugar epimerase